MCLCTFLSTHVPVCRYVDCDKTLPQIMAFLEHLVSTEVLDASGGMYTIHKASGGGGGGGVTTMPGLATVAVLFDRVVGE